MSIVPSIYPQGQVASGGRRWYKIVRLGCLWTDGFYVHTFYHTSVPVAWPVFGVLCEEQKSDPSSMVRRQGAWLTEAFWSTELGVSFPPNSWGLLADPLGMFSGLRCFKRCHSNLSWHWVYCRFWVYWPRHDGWPTAVSTEASRTDDMYSFCLKCLIHGYLRHCHRYQFSPVRAQKCFLLSQEI